VCVAGRVLPGGPKIKTEAVAGENVRVCNFSIRSEDAIADVSAWRDMATKAGTLQAGTLFALDAVKKITLKGNDKSRVGLRYLSVTEQGACHSALANILDESAGTDAAGAELFSWRPAGGNRDYTSEEAAWFSLSLCSLFTVGNQRAHLESVVQVPSVFVSALGDGITYVACALCAKRARDGSKTCDCQSPETTLRWHASLRLQDNNCQVTASIVDAMKDLATMFRASDDELNDEVEKPDYYHDHPERVEALMGFLAARPVTVLLSFQDSEYNNSIELVVRMAEHTWNANPKLVRHPLKPILRTSVDLPGCPPCAVADTSFDAGSGLAVVPGGGADSFRVLVRVVDKPPTAERESEASPAVRVTRKVECVLAPSQNTQPVSVTFSGPINVATNFLPPRKGEVIHALVSWRCDDALTLLSFCDAPFDAAQYDAYQLLFRKEVDLHKGVDDAKLYKDEKDHTPNSKHKAVMWDAQQAATPEPWSKRMRND
jgi:hypothetical protein